MAANICTRCSIETDNDDSNILNAQIIKSLYSFFAINKNQSCCRGLSLQAYDILTQFAISILNGHRADMYTLYILFKERLTDTTTNNVLDACHKFLSFIIWDKLSECYGSEVYNSICLQFNKIILNKSLADLEHEVHRIVRNTITNNCQLMTKYNIRNNNNLNCIIEVRRWGYDCRYSNHLTRDFICKYQPDRSRSSFARAVYQTVHDPALQLWVKQVQCDYFIEEFKRLSYNWPWLKQSSLEDIIIIGDNNIAQENYQFLPPIHLPHYIYNPQFVAKVMESITADATLKKLTWQFLKVPQLTHHDLLVQSLSPEQLHNISAAQSLCDVALIKDSSPCWNTLLADIGEILLCRALDSIGCDKNNDVGIDKLKRAMRNWYKRDTDFVLVALCNNTNSKGQVHAKQLSMIMHSRNRNGLL